jgi:hypothetical protein
MAHRAQVRLHRNRLHLQLDGERRQPRRVLRGPTIRPGPPVSPWKPTGAGSHAPGGPSGVDPVAPASCACAAVHRKLPLRSPAAAAQLPTFSMAVLPATASCRSLVKWTGIPGPRKVACQPSGIWWELHS